jgi:glutathione S-transferase
LANTNVLTIRMYLKNITATKQAVQHLYVHLLFQRNIWYARSDYYAEASAMPPLLMNLILSRFGLADSDAMDAFVAPQIKLHYDYIESELQKNAWFVGEEFTAADIEMSFPLELLVAQLKQIENRPKIKEFVERIHARPAYKRALERGGKYDFANNI